MLVNECIKLQTMHLQRGMFILCQIQVNYSHRDLPQPEIIQSELERVLLWGCGTLV